MDRLVQHNVLAMSGRAVEAAGDVSTLLLDKTGTITYGNRQADPADRRRPASTWTNWPVGTLAASLADETPEGKSIVEMCRDPLRRGPGRGAAADRCRDVVEFSATHPDVAASTCPGRPRRAAPCPSARARRRR